jgi:hypothetical protein
MEKQEKAALKEQVAEVLERYNLFFSQTWWTRYCQLIQLHRNWSAKKQPRGSQPNEFSISPSKLKKRLESLRNFIRSEKEILHLVAQPDLFGDDKDSEFRDFCSTEMIPLCEQLHYVEHMTSALIELCPSGRQGRKRNAQVHNFVLDVSSLLKIINNNRIGITFVPESETYCGPLYELVAVSIKYLKMNSPPSSEALAEVIQNAMLAEEWTAVYFEHPERRQETQSEVVAEMQAKGLSLRSIAKEMGLSKSKVHRLANKK